MEIFNFIYFLKTCMFLSAILEVTARKLNLEELDSFFHLLPKFSTLTLPQAQKIVNEDEVRQN